jgi:uncharacterized membrane protein YtjA (UPF0391 family)
VSLIKEHDPTYYASEYLENLKYGGLTMRSSNISRILFILVLLVLLLNTVISAANAIEDGILLRRVIPAVCWGIASIIWIASYFRKSRGEN